MGSLVFRITGDPTAFKAAMGEVSSSLDGAARRAEATSAKLSALGSTLSLGVTLPAIALGTSLVKTAANMEALRKGLDSVATAADPTSKQLERLKEVAKLPGLGFEEAIQGSVRLQSAGFSANLAERSLKAFGNALATVGRGKAELDGVALALSQIASKGKISAEEINQLAERVPQIRKVMKDAFGTADTEVLQKAGIGAEEFVSKVVTELEKLKPVAGGTKNAFENLSDAVTQAADRIGQKLLPTVNAAIPKLEAFVLKAVDAVDAFTNLPPQIQNAALAIGAFAIAAGPIAGIIGRITAAIGAMRTAMGLASAGFFGLFGAVAVAAITQTMTAIDDLKAKQKDYFDFLDRRKTGKEELITYPEGQVPTGALNDGIGKASEKVNRFGIDLKAIGAELDLFGAKTKAATEESKKMSSALGEKSKAYADATGKVKDHTKAKIELKLATLDVLIAQKQAKERLDQYNQAIDKAAELGIKYGGVTREQIALNIQVADSLFRYYRVLENPPDVKIPGIGGGIGSIPKADMPTFPGDFEEYKRSAKNIGDLGMMTKEQYEAMASAAKRSSREQSAALRQVSTVITDLSRGIARSIIEWKGWGEMVKGVAKSAGEAIIRELVEKALSKLASKLLDVGGIAGKVFGGGTGAVMSAAGGGASAAGSAAGGIGGGASAAGAAASTGIMGAIGVVSGVVSAVSGVIGNFQMAGMNKTLDLIEKEVRYSQIHLLHLLEKNNEYLPKLKDIWESLIRMETRQMAVGGGGGAITFDFRGSTFGAGTSQTQVEAMFKLAVEKFKRQGLN